MHNSGLLKNSRVLSDQTLTYAVLLAFNKHISAQTVDLFYGLLNYSKKNLRCGEWLQQSRLHWIVIFPIWNLSLNLSLARSLSVRGDDPSPAEY